MSSPATPPRPADRPARPRRPLGPGLTTFLVIDVILVITLIVVAGLALGERDTTPTAEQTPTPTTEPETSPEQTAPAAPDDAQALETFVLPSGNIWCQMSPDAATCTILQFSYERPEKPADCPGEVGNVLTVSAEAEAMSFPCLEGPPPPAPEGTPVLDYGGASTLGEMTCLSSRNGVFCRHDPSGAGFSVARAGVTRF